MYRFWFERSLPDRYAPLLDGVAVVIGSAADSPGQPFAALPEAEAIIASARLLYDGPVMDQAPGLRVISRTGIGTENVLVPEATERGIVVCNTPDAPTIATAEMALTLILAVARDVKRVMQALEQGERRDFFPQYDSLELYQRCLGIVGLGRIGGRLAQIAQALGMNVVAFDPYVPPERAAELRVDLRPSLEEVLRLADIVSLHVPATSETRHLIDARRLALMKPGAILINTARGSLVDEAALVEALDRGQLSGAGLDVLEVEPPPQQHPLLGRPNVLITPHVASATQSGKDRLWQTAINQALQALQGDRPAGLVNPEVWQRRK